MADARAHRVTRAPGRLVLNPIDLSKAYPHDGTGLGMTRDVAWHPHQENFEVIAEEYACVVEAAYVGESGVLSCVVREMDNDLLATVFVDTVVGATTGRNVVQQRVTTEDVRPGQLLDGVAIYFSPDNKLHHGVLLYRAVPMLDAAAAINYRLDEDIGLAVVFRATPDATGRPFQVGPREDLTL